MNEPLFLIIPALLLTAGYCMLLLWYLIWWLKIPGFNAAKTVPYTKVSIIIAMRNEEKNIMACLESIAAQDYPHELLEVILLDDHSTDNGEHLVREFRKRQTMNLSFVLLRDGGHRSSYKKFAINIGIVKATGTLIITTDADCTMDTQWLSTIVSYYEKHKPVMMMAPVLFKTDHTLFSNMQALEFAGLIGMGAASNAAGAPLMCNGANLAYTREAYMEIDGFGNTPAMASGDDTFLLFKMQEKYPGGIHFIKSNEAAVMTNPQPTPVSFFRQRKRWASKTTRYNKPYVTIIGLLIYFFNFTLLTALICSAFNPALLRLFILMLSCKLLFEFAYSAVVCRFSGNEKLLWAFIPASLLFIPYVLLVGIAAPFGSYEWKGRLVK